MTLNLKNVQIHIKLILCFVCFLIFYLLLQTVIRENLRVLENDEDAYMEFERETDNLIADLNSQSISIFQGANSYLVEHSAAKLIAEKNHLSGSLSKTESLIPKIQDGAYSEVGSHLLNIKESLTNVLTDVSVFGNEMSTEAQRTEALASLNSNMQILSTHTAAISQANINISQAQADRIQETVTSIWRVTLLFGTVGIVVVAILFYIFAHSIRSAVRQALAFTKHLEKGEFWAEPTYEGRDDVGKIVGAINNMKNQIKEILTTVDETTKGILSASHEFSSGASVISAGASEQASASAEVSSTMELISDGIRKVSSQSNETSLVAKNAYLEIEAGVKKVFETVNAIEEIANKNKVIGEISYQTKILSINASVEAARAAEYGRGFASVAEQVKRLAEDSQESAAVIGAVSKRGVSLSNESAKMLNAIVPHIKETSTLISEIGEMGNEQIQAIDQITTSIGDLNNVIQQNAASSEELASSSEELVRTVESLRDQISFFKLEKEVEETADSSESVESEGKEESSTTSTNWGGHDDGGNAQEGDDLHSNSFEDWLKSRDLESNESFENPASDESEPTFANDMLASDNSSTKEDRIRYPKFENSEIEGSSSDEVKEQMPEKDLSKKKPSGLSNSGVRISLADNDDLDSGFEKMK